MQRRRILLIDDDRLFAQVVAKALGSEAYDLTHAISGAEGLARAQQDPPDLILLDVMMPDMDGYSVCSQLRQNSATANVPVIMITALDEIGEKVRGLQVGADDYITKPCDLEELLTRVQTHLRRSERDLNVSPLTYLPGNPVIEQVLTTFLSQPGFIAVLYIDLTNFKEYNDEYGWLKGDEVIRLLARTIREVLDWCGGKEDFLGHIGGDDFVVISTPDRAASIAEQVISRFDTAIPEYYRAQDRERGFIDTHDRRGKPFRAALLSLKIAIVTNRRRKLSHPAQAAELAAEVKRHLKSHPGSHFAFERNSK
ncbi:MAG TPA: response regulator [Anaerolineae bacterium]